MKNLITLCCIFLFIGNTAYAQSKIKKAEDSLKKDEQTNENPTLTYNNPNGSDTSNGDFFTEAVGGLFVQIFAYTAYAAVFESPFEMEHKASSAHINKSPYYNSKKGNYSYNWDKNSSIFRSVLSGRYISENSRLKGTHLNLNMRALKRWGLELNYLQLWEDNPNFGSDQLAIYTALAKYYRVRTEKFDAWWGLGTSYVDGSVNQFGFAYGLGAELFFAKPLSLEANFNQTRINNSNVNKFNALLHYHLKQYRLTGGYEHLKIGSEKFSLITLGLGVFF